MSKLQKADFKIEVSEKMKQDTENLSADLRKDPAVQTMMRRNGIPAEMIEKRPWSIDSWRKEYAPCLGCHGLSACTQKLKGYYPDLRYDGILQETMAPCRYQREKQKAEKHLEQYRINDLPESMRTISFDNIYFENESEDYTNLVMRLIAASSQHKGIYLYGTMGSGKTYLAACAANDHARSGERTSFVHYPSFVQRLAAAIHDGEYKTELQRAMYCDFLVLDDIGAEAVTEWNRDSILLPLLNHRYESGLTTWFTSNCDLDMLQVHYTFTRDHEDQMKAARIMERIRHMAAVETLSEKDRRKNVQNSFQ